MTTCIITSAKVADTLPSFLVPLSGLAGEELTLDFGQIREIELPLAVALMRAARENGVTLVVGENPAFVVTGPYRGEVRGAGEGPRAGLMIEQDEFLSFMGPATSACDPLRTSFGQLSADLPDQFGTEEELKVRADPLHPAVALVIADVMLGLNPSSIRYRKLGAKAKSWQSI